MRPDEASRASGEVWEVCYVKSEMAPGRDEVLGDFLLVHVVRSVQWKVVVGCSGSDLGNSGSMYGRFKPKWGRTRKVGGKEMKLACSFIRQRENYDFFSNGMLSSTLQDCFTGGWNGRYRSIQDFKSF
ncbi:hypothetical protein L1887_35682 [Cichorium endivia]|nr:hypothetical protein L1887_35682 [Cichorium endivia]